MWMPLTITFLLAILLEVYVFNRDFISIYTVIMILTFELQASFTTACATTAGGTCKACADNSRRRMLPLFEDRMQGNDSDSPKIVGGANANFGDVPWQVALSQAPGNSISVFCGGTLIHADWVLTAAHCTSG